MAPRARSGLVQYGGASQSGGGHHQFQCSYRWARRGIRVATRSGLAQHDWSSQSGSGHHRLHYGYLCVRRGTKVQLELGLLSTMKQAKVEAHAYGFITATCAVGWSLSQHHRHAVSVHSDTNLTGLTLPIALFKFVVLMGVLASHWACPTVWDEIRHQL